MDPLIAFVLLLTGVAIGWLARGLVTRRSEHTHIWTTTSPMRCVVCRRPVLPWWRRLRQRYALWRALRQAKKRAHDPDKFATGGVIRGPRDPGDDSIPVLLSEGGCLMYPHGDHSGPTAMDEQSDDPAVWSYRCHMPDGDDIVAEGLTVEQAAAIADAVDKALEEDHERRDDHG